ncbi:MAG: 1-deoxy-D-xylulose-5-phosphate reductoisomerase, partial [Clostridiales bacterium]|nr:1-deoxy-D-xylulose-5-phosphate reductoisomerase [Clostridiales bacterium]
TLLERQIRKYKPRLAAVADEKAAAALKLAVADTDTKVTAGEDGLCEVSVMRGVQAVLTSVVGIAGLVPTLAAIESGKDILLANKETLVAAGDLVMAAAKERRVNILPVDSEHSAVFQCLQGASGAVRRILLTASGGAFFGKTAKELKNVSLDDALRHPNWSMGRKITVDSATLMNKGFEVIEARHLFGVPYERIEVVIHRESIIHSMVEFEDCSVLAQMGVPDMRLPLHYALCYPKRLPSAARALDFTEISRLSFAQPDCGTFPLLPLAFAAGTAGGTAPAALNAANEAAVALFLKNKIRFADIADIVTRQVEAHKNAASPSLGDIIATDRQIKEVVFHDYGNFSGGNLSALDSDA